jgi:hypothetical protein
VIDNPEARGEQRTSAYVAYRAALDRENAAACDLERLWHVFEPCRDSLLPDGPQPVE